MLVFESGEAGSAQDAEPPSSLLPPRVTKIRRLAFYPLSTRSSFDSAVSLISSHRLGRFAIKAGGKHVLAQNPATGLPWHAIRSCRLADGLFASLRLFMPLRWKPSAVKRGISD
jgi:hypothetical protein